MQRGIIKEVREIASEGKKSFYEVILQDSSKMTTFDSKIKQADSGDTLDFEVSVAGKYINLKDGWKLTKQTSSSEEGKPSGNGYQMSKGEWAEKQRIERESIENQVRAKLIVELRTAGVFDDKHPTYKKCLMWLDKLEAPTAVPKQESIPVKAVEELFPEEEKPQGTVPQTTEELLVWIMEKMNWKSSTPAKSFIVNKCKISEEKIESDPLGVYYEVKALQGW